MAEHDHFGHDSRDGHTMADRITGTAPASAYRRYWTLDLGRW
jgi:uncharacterized protein YkwD